VLLNCRIWAPSLSSWCEATCSQFSSWCDATCSQMSMGNPVIALHSRAEKTLQIFFLTRQEKSGIPYWIVPAEYVSCR
jgi:hypothetical protein